MTDKPDFHDCSKDAATIRFALRNASVFLWMAGAIFLVAGMASPSHADMLAGAGFALLLASAMQLVGLFWRRFI